MARKSLVPSENAIRQKAYRMRKKEMLSEAELQLKRVQNAARNAKFRRNKQEKLAKSKEQSPI